MKPLHASRRTELTPHVEGVEAEPRPAAEVQRKRRRRALRQAALAFAILTAATAAVMALRPSPVPVDAASAVRGPLAVVIEESGTTRVKDRYLVSAPVSGTLSRIALEPGDAIVEAQPLAEIAPARSTLLDPRTRAEAEARRSAAQAALGQARGQQVRALAAKQQAEQELARMRRLQEQSSASAQALEQALFVERMREGELSSAVFASKVAREELRIAEVALAHDSPSREQQHVDVLAPASGRVLRVLQRSAGLVQAGTPLLEVGDPEALEVVVDLLTTDAVHIEPGTDVVLEGWGEDRPLAGRVRRVEPSAFTRLSALGVDEQRVNVLIALAAPRSAWSRLGDGYRVQVRIVLWRGEQVLKVPQGAAFRYGQGWSVFRILDGTVERVPVEVGHRGETEVEIVSGLSAGDRVAVHPGDRVRDGVRVELR